MKRLLQIGMLLLIATASLAATSPAVGTWTAKTHDLPIIRMVIKQSGGKLSGVIDFYFQQQQNGVWKVTSNDRVTILEPQFAGDTLTFKVPHAKRHGSTDPADQEIKVFTLRVQGKDAAELRDTKTGMAMTLQREK